MTKRATDAQRVKLDKIADTAKSIPGVAGFSIVLLTDEGVLTYADFIDSVPPEMKTAFWTIVNQEAAQHVLGFDIKSLCQPTDEEDEPKVH